MTHQHHAPDPTTDPTTDPATFWEQRYRDRGQTWSGCPNAALVSEVAGVPAGRALDLGAGEGGDAIWLAQQGWSVTAVDISPSALALGARNAEAAGVAERIEWLAADLASWQPADTFDLVSAQFLQSPVEFPREEVLRRATSAVAPGGRLIVVAHAQFPPWSSHAQEEAELPTPESDLAALALPTDGWTVLTQALVERQATGPDGSTAPLVDTVVTVRRR